MSINFTKLNSIYEFIVQLFKYRATYLVLGLIVGAFITTHYIDYESAKKIAESKSKIDSLQKTIIEYDTKISMYQNQLQSVNDDIEKTKNTIKYITKNKNIYVSPTITNEDSAYNYIIGFINSSQ